MGNSRVSGEKGCVLKFPEALTSYCKERLSLYKREKYRFELIFFSTLDSEKVEKSQGSFDFSPLSIQVRASSVILERSCYFKARIKNVCTKWKTVKKLSRKSLIFSFKM